MSAQYDDENYQSNDCIDCNASMRPLDDLREWLEIGPICYGCLASRLEKVEARVKELEDFATEVKSVADRTCRSEHAIDNLERIANKAESILGDEGIK